MMRGNNLRESVLSRLGDRSVVFVGMMGSGKSAIGRLVAQMLTLPYFDADEEIVTAAGMSIPDIFAQFGEDYFRKGEQRVVFRLLADGPAVLSLGGGAYINEETRERIRESAIAVWLEADIDLLMSRVSRRPSTRPLLQNKDPRAVMKDLMEKRTPIYRLADISVRSSRNSKNETANDVIAALDRWLSGDTGESTAPAGLTQDMKR